MFFSKAVLISVLGLSALSVAAPIEDGVTAQAAAPATGCSWYDSITGRDCDDDDPPAPRPSPRPSSSWPAWGVPKSSGNNNPSPSQPKPFPNQPYPNRPNPPQPTTGQPSLEQPSLEQPYPNPQAVAPAPSTPRPAKGLQPRPFGSPRPITAPKGDGTDKVGQSSWCDRPDPARRPASCGNGGTLVTTPPRNTPNGASENEASEKKAPKEKAPKEKAPENEGEGESYWQQAASSKGSRGQDDEE
ncbi:hypothetical protein EG328_003136 [Venturia inaequalis]|uniref:Uncharacterized protein n=1 Tax=Venturia inaequalis TaxID=5025 RepID=A0A8H3USL8_VENIN|nr:hypothetical protein EG328_003136 [Venturia inaequalis]